MELRKLNQQEIDYVRSLILKRNHLRTKHGLAPSWLNYALDAYRLIDPVTVKELLERYDDGFYE